jgi:hypothetical protein
VRRRVGNDFADRKERSSLIATMAGKMEAVRLVIEMRDPQALSQPVLFGEATCEEGPRGFHAIKLQREFGTLIPHGNQLRDAALPAYLNRIRNDNPFWRKHRPLGCSLHAV